MKNPSRFTSQSTSRLFLSTLFALLALAVCAGLIAHAADGDLDPSFSGDGKQTTSFFNGDLANDVVLQSDGKIIAAGLTVKPNGNGVFALARYNIDGTLDKTFSGDGKTLTAFAGHSVVAFDLGLLSDGKIVVMGSTFDEAEEQDTVLARYNRLGGLDATFSGDGKLITDLGGDDITLAGLVQPDGRIVVAGSVAPSENDPLGFEFLLARFLNHIPGVPASLAGDSLSEKSFGDIKRISAAHAAAGGRYRALTKTNSKVRKHVFGMRFGRLLPISQS